MRHLVSALHKIQPKSGLVKVLGELMYKYRCRVSPKKVLKEQDSKWFSNENFLFWFFCDTLYLLRQGIKVSILAKIMLFKVQSIHQHGKCITETLLLANLGNLWRFSYPEMEILVSRRDRDHGNCSISEDTTCPQLCPVFQYLLDYLLKWSKTELVIIFISLFLNLYWYVKIVVLYCIYYKNSLKRWFLG